MSLDMTTYESVCYVHCHFCNTILVVTVPLPCISSLDVVTIRCGHCTNFLYVNMGALQHTVHLQGLQKQNSPSFQDSTSIKDFGSSSKCNKVSMLGSSNHDQPRSVLTTPVTPQKRQRVPSAYNRFIKEEIQRIKANNPDISHKEAFSTAAKNWAHFPHMQFGLTLNNAAAAAAAGGTNKKLVKPISEEAAATPKDDRQSQM